MSFPDSFNLGQAGKDLGNVLSLAGAIRGLTSSSPSLRDFAGPGFGIGPTGVGTPSFRFSDPAVLSATPGSIRSGLTDAVTGASRQSQQIADQFGSLAGGTGGYASELAGLGGDVAGLRARLGALAEGVDPATGRLRSAVANTYATQAAEATGNLRESLSRRGVLGSSFANDAEARIAQQFGQQEAMTQAQVESESIKMAQSLLETDARLVSQQADLIAKRVGLDEFSSAQLSKQLTAIRQSSDVIREGVAIELSELGVSAVVARDFTGVASNNAAYDIAAAIKDSAAKGTIMGALGGVAGAPGILERAGTTLGGLFGGSGGLASVPGIDALGAGVEGTTTGSTFLPGAFGVPGIDALGAFDGFPAAFGADTITGGAGSTTLGGNIGSDILSGAGNFLSGSNLASLAGPAAFAAAGLPVAAAFLGGALTDNTLPAMFTVPANTPAEQTGFSRQYQGDISGLTAGDLNLIAEVMQIRGQYGPGDFEASGGWANIPSRNLDPRYFGISRLTPAAAEAIYADAKRRGINIEDVYRMNTAPGKGRG